MRRKIRGTAHNVVLKLNLINEELEKTRGNVSLKEMYILKLLRWWGFYAETSSRPIEIYQWSSKSVTRLGLYVWN